MVKYSIIVPVYNVDKYLAKCLDALLGNDRTDFEVLLINDGSKDNSIAICQKYAKQDERIVLIDQPNMGLSGARNTGIENARGEYLLFVDSDDWVSEDYLDMIDTTMISDCDVVVFGYTNLNDSTGVKHIYDLKNATYKGLKIGEGIAELDRMGYLFNLVWNKVYRKNLLGKLRFEKGLTYCEDIVFNSELFKKVHSVSFSDMKYYYYRSSDSSLTNNRYYPNYGELSDKAIKARLSIYEYYGIDNLHQDILNSKELAYRLGEISNLYRSKSPLKYVDRVNVLHAFRSISIKYKHVINTIGCIERLEYNIASKMPSIMADALLSFLFKLKKYKY